MPVLRDPGRWEVTLDERLDQVRYLVELRSRLDEEITKQEKPFVEAAKRYWTIEIHLDPDVCCENVELQMGTRVVTSSRGTTIYFEWWCQVCSTSEGFYVPMGYLERHA